MKNNYIKTTWVDNKTPVNAANMNHIESAISDLYSSSISASEIVQGDGIKVSVDTDKSINISTDSTVMRSDTISGVEMIYTELSSYEKNKIYFLLDSETKKLKKILINGVTIYEME